MCPLKLKSTKHAIFRDGNEKSPLEDFHFLKLEKERWHSQIKREFLNHNAEKDKWFNFDNVKHYES